MQKGVFGFDVELATILGSGSVDVNDIRRWGDLGLLPYLVSAEGDRLYHLADSVRLLERQAWSSVKYSDRQCEREGNTHGD